ncbi:putative ABC transport system permease protein [Undibacterium sp. GrIS 1.2]|uniref:ABC transporter permease n=1 Tax=Undibacterium sp. GrIS 1.2 TaxID=3143933 RepID=UPI003396921C
MNFKDFRMGWRLLQQQPVYSAIMIVSLTIGFTFCFLVLAFTRYEFGFDTNVPEVQNVYVVKARPNWGFGFWSENVPLSMKDSLEKSDAPLLVTAVLPYSAAMRVNDGGNDVVTKVELTLVDPAFSKVFGIKPMEGDLQAALSRPDALALSVATAQKLFGDRHVVGKNLQIRGASYRIAAVLPDQPATSSIQFSALAGLNSAAWPEAERQRARDNWNYYSYDDKNFLNNKVYFRLLPNTLLPSTQSNATSGNKTDIKSDGLLSELASAINTDISRSALAGHLNTKDTQELGNKPLLKIAFGALAESHLDSEARSNSGSKGDPIATLAMSAVAFLILLLTAGNYVNLATIRTIARQREMAIRKVLGVTAGRLLMQMMAESILVSLIAAIAGAFLAWLLLPVWSELTELDMVNILTRQDWMAFAAIVIVMGILVGICAALYPGWIALKMRPANALGGRGNSETAGGLWLRRVLTVMQFAIAMFVTGVVMTIGTQIQYLKHIDYGYQLDSLLIINLPAELSQTEVRSFQDALARRPEINGVANTTPWPAKVEFKTTKTETISLSTLRVGPEYFHTIGLGAAVGRVFDPNIDAGDNSNGLVMNELAATRLGYANGNAALGQIVSMEGKAMQIVGISKNVSSGFMHGSPRPIVYQIATSEKSSLAPLLPQLTVNGRNDLTAAKTAITEVWHQHFPDMYLNLSHLRQNLEVNAGGPQAIFDSCVIVAAIMIPLAIFSIYILSAYAVQRRAKEIVMRKLFGADKLDIAKLLLKEFTILLSIAAIVGLPLSYVAGRGFVEQFADQAPMGLWPIVLALLGAVVVTLLATTRHTLIAARMSPAVALRAA